MIRTAALLAAALLLVGCSGDSTPVPDSGADATNDSSSADAGDAGDAADSGPPADYHDITTSSLWSTFDTATIGASAFLGSVFDGRYLWLVPQADMLARYDTQATFTDAASWKTLDTSTIPGGPIGFAGGAFDGRYVYFVPNSFHTIVRFDTQATFGASAATTYDVGASGFAGAVFDGRYLYLVPWQGAAYTGLTVRYDTQASFTSAASWSSFDLTTVNANAKGFYGGAFDGRYVYYTPNYNGASFDGLVARYDTQASFTTAAGWSMFDTSTVTPGEGYRTAGFDGRYLYLAPEFAGLAGHVVPRYDTQASFDAGASWSTFDTHTASASAQGFFGAAFDGRYMFFAPYYMSGTVARFDTQASFGAAGSWSTFDTTSVASSSAGGYADAAFDGRYVYFVPNLHTTVVRFDAKSPSSMPKLPGWFGSFF